MGNGNYGKWFKFNDTNVEEVEMSDQLIESEWFGGRYTMRNESKRKYLDRIQHDDCCSLFQHLSFRKNVNATGMHIC